MFFSRFFSLVHRYYFELSVQIFGHFAIVVPCSFCENIVRLVQTIHTDHPSR